MKFYPTLEKFIVKTKLKLVFKNIFNPPNIPDIIIIIII